MGVRSAYLITDPQFSEYVYFIMKTASPEVRSRLNTRELADFRSDTAMRKFADEETMERRMLLLTRLGCTWTMCIQTERTQYDEMFKDITKDYPYVTKNMDMVKGMKEGQMFVFGSRNMMLYQQLAENQCHSQLYILDHDYLRTRRAIVPEKQVKRVDKVKESASTYEDFAKLVFHAITAFRQIEPTSHQHISDIQLRLLLILLGFRDRYVGIRSLCGKMGEPQRNIGVKKSLEHMVKTGHVNRISMPAPDKWDTNAYMIAEKGIDAAMTFLKYVKNKAYHDPA